ncbi:MAG: hypothetical protein IPL78_15700 [Chloroflexi bacterium]|nr:hypothetical protein [Chloroflexota bacterium]
MTNQLAACVVGWIDWDGDNVFEASSTGGLSEMVVNRARSASTTFTVSFASPTTAQYGGTYPSTLNARFRIFLANDPLLQAVWDEDDGLGCVTSSSATSLLPLVFGEAADGEVEDYQWGFSPTTITLNNLDIAPRQSVLPGVSVLIAGLFTIITFVTVLKRRRSVL